MCQLYQKISAQKTNYQDFSTRKKGFKGRHYLKKPVGNLLNNVGAYLKVKSDTATQFEHVLVDECRASEQEKNYRKERAETRICVFHCSCSVLDFFSKVKSVKWQKNVSSRKFRQKVDINFLAQAIMKNINILPLVLFQLFVAENTIIIIRASFMH